MKENINVITLIDTFKDMANRGSLLTGRNVSQDDIFIQIIGTIIKVAMEEDEQEQLKDKILEELSDLEIDDCANIISNTGIDCSTCKYNTPYPPPHTCDVCTSLDQEEQYEMWEPKE